MLPSTLQDKIKPEKADKSSIYHNNTIMPEMKVIITGRLWSVTTFHQQSDHTITVLSQSYMVTQLISFPLDAHISQAHKMAFMDTGSTIRLTKYSVLKG